MITLDGVPASTLARRWGVPKCQVLTSVESALDVVHDWGEAGAPTGSVVVAVEQTAGRGRDGRSWSSPEGGAWFAVLLRPAGGVAGATLGIVSIRAGMLVADVVDELLGAPEARLKWPNDVLLRDRKLAGVLCEGRWQGDAVQWLAVGLGVNVANEIPAPLRATAITLREVLPEVRPLDVLDRLVPPLARLGAPTSRLTEPECTAFAARDWLRDRVLKSPVAGRGAGVRDDGALLVAVASEMAVVREGHVETA
ncbi:MAG TPA: biotin--[acetyl-CoA-carboxylase] ligase [Gemmatimonadales bacterium]|nr:biotin--[acetyl-CoA-carboxylase] ligase [Gemmatimonadales bacterium]